MDDQYVWNDQKLYSSLLTLYWFELERLLTLFLIDSYWIVAIPRVWIRFVYLCRLIDILYAHTFYNRIYIIRTEWMWLNECNNIHHLGATLIVFRNWLKTWQNLDVRGSSEILLNTRQKRKNDSIACLARSEEKLDQNGHFVNLIKCCVAHDKRRKRSCWAKFVIFLEVVCQNWVYNLHCWRKTCRVSTARGKWDCANHILIMQLFICCWRLSYPLTVSELVQGLHSSYNAFFVNGLPTLHLDRCESG